MAAQWPVLSNRDLNRTKNKKAVDEVVPFVYETVITWGCRKDEDESFTEYYDRRQKKLWEDNKEKWEEDLEKELENSKKNWSEERINKEIEKRLKKMEADTLKTLPKREKWTNEEVEHLSEKNCKRFDATLMHKLVPKFCDDIGIYDSNVPSSTNIEKFLREVKVMRNDICHDPQVASVSDSSLDKLEVSAVNVFNAAGALYSLDKQRVQEKIDELKEKLQKIKEEVMTDEHQRILQTAKKMTGDGMDEMKEAVWRQATDYLPYSDGKFTRKDIYHDVSVSMSVENENEKAELPEDKKTDEFRSTEILQKNEGDAILLEGEPGSGKTTLLRRLQEDYFATGKKLFAGLHMFELLLFMDCRDNTLENIWQLLKRTFPKTMNQLKEEEVLQALHELKLLICVDGLDELNKNSRKLMYELTHTFTLPGNATFVCTSRPGQSDTLRSVKYKTMTLQPVTQEKEQIAFLERYQANIKGIVAPELIRAFKSLVQSCKDCFRQPIYLALFCYLFRKFKQEVCLWKNELSIMENILTLSEQTMIERMQTMNFENRHDYANAFTKAITQLSVQLVYRGEVIIDKTTYTELELKIFGKAEEDHYSIMSSYFTRHADGQSFNFYHKSYLEFLAAKQLYKSFHSNKQASIIAAIRSHKQNRASMSDGVAPVPGVAPGPDVSLVTDVVTAPDAPDGEENYVKRFENVLRFLSMMLVEGGPEMEGALKHFLKEACPALAKEQVPFRFWVALTLSCPDSNHVAEAAAEAAKAVSEKETSNNRGKWPIATARDMNAVSRMLRYHQPAWLDIRPLRSEGLLGKQLGPLLEAVAQWHTGQLDLFLEASFLSFHEIDHLVIYLKTARCILRQFLGCIGSSQEVGQVFAAAVRRAEEAGVLPELAVALTKPRQHQLAGLEGTRHRLGFLALLDPSEVGQSRPLPRSSERPPQLGVNCRFVTEEAATKTASLIKDLAGNDGQYYNIALQKWPGTNDELHRLLQQLKASVVNTEDSGSLRWSPSCYFADGRCDLCLTFHEKDSDRCVAIAVPERNPRDEVEVTRVDTDDIMREYALKLPNHTLPWLEVTTKGSKAPPHALRPLMEAVAKWHQGNLELNFYHSYYPFVAVDDFLDPLHAARCPIVIFFGCLGGSSESAWRALVEGVRRAELAGLKQILCISLLHPRHHKLIELDGTRHSLDIRVRLPSSLGDRHRRPLPTSPLRPLWLTVVFMPESKTSVDEKTLTEQTVALVEDLAPKDMRYLGVALLHYPNTDASLEDIVARLLSSGVRTSGVTPSWMEAGKDGKGNCGTCKASCHPKGVRCVRILLP